MKKIKIESFLDVYPSKDALPEAISSLMDAAFEAREKAYAPYSDFLVGAALLLDNGVVVTGNNQENACYPGGLCAERTAIFYASSQYPDAVMVSMAITARAKDKETTVPIPPCGICRQAIAEYEIKQKSPISLYFMGERGEVLKSDSLENILPLLFTAKYL
ncbi:cytidine deaminase [Dokdonia sp. Hel_I_63]|jgi:cytidine deaminase|uniref:cytidine deaminase n=1 Tax=unclassified Dokdonia TaxID=2615033 RepID=UPI00020A6D6C|nr:MULTISPECIES: cytidine deaminase [unclassified Dokdonia]AEE18562.1 CMP/dCMP deaminase zinc-binding protein [Dokdonia sp. 4H-3-7-5]TVZ22208.1 cytidine deaminase [Dokdonia sp. Hel_I_63]